MTDSSNNGTTLKEQLKSRGRVTWNEDILAKHARERGVLYGTMKIDQPDTPFLVYDADKAENRRLGGRDRP